MGEALWPEICRPQIVSTLHEGPLWVGSERSRLTAIDPLQTYIPAKSHALAAVEREAGL